MGVTFWDRTAVQPNGCWLWTGPIHDSRMGYGQISFRGGYRLAHRVAYELVHGLFPDELFVLHTCDNPPCVRPDHLFLGDWTDNNRDRRAKGRSAVGDRHGFRLHPELIPRGEQNGKSKLKAADIPLIRQALARGESAPSIARRLGRDPSTIYAVKYGRTWSHVP